MTVLQNAKSSRDTLLTAIRRPLPVNGAFKLRLSPRRLTQLLRSGWPSGVSVIRQRNSTEVHSRRISHPVTLEVLGAYGWGNQPSGLRGSRSVSAPRNGAATPLDSKEECHKTGSNYLKSNDDFDALRTVQSYRTLGYMVTYGHTWSSMVNCHRIVIRIQCRLM